MSDADFLAATEDMQMINEYFIDDYNNKIQGLRQEIASLEKLKQQCTQTFNQTSLDQLKELSRNEEKLAEHELAYSKYKNKTTTGIIILLAGMFTIFTRMLNPLLGIIISIVGGCIWHYAAGKEYYDVAYGKRAKTEDFEKYISDSKLQVENAKKNKTNTIYEYDKKIKNFNNRVAALHQQIDDHHGKIEDCKKYLDLGRERIATMFFAQKCEVFGVQQPFDNAISVCRETAFNVQEKPHEETVNINCPVCNGTLTIDESVLNAGECDCPHCGNILLEFQEVEN